MFRRRPWWISQFATTMNDFGVDADADHIIELAEVVFESHSRLDPVAVARSEVDKWPQPADDAHHEH